VADSGYLYSAGLWRLGVKGGVLRYWPASFEVGKLELAKRVLVKPVVADDTVWLDDRLLRIVADFPSEFYRDEVACSPNAPGGPDTEEVWLWLIAK